MNTIDLVALPLATRTVLFGWFQEGGLFAKQYAYMEARGGKLGKLFTCPYCLGLHVCAALMLLFVLPAALLAEPWGLLPRIPLYTLALTTVVHAIVGAPLHLRSDTAVSKGVSSERMEARVSPHDAPVEVLPAVEPVERSERPLSVYDVEQLGTPQVQTGAKAPVERTAGYIIHYHIYRVDNNEPKLVGILRDLHAANARLVRLHEDNPKTGHELWLNEASRLTRLDPEPDAESGPQQSEAATNP